MTSSDVWTAEQAQRYDDPAGTGMSAPEVLDPVVDALAELAGGGPVLELAIGTGRVAVPLLTKGGPGHRDRAVRPDGRRAADEGLCAGPAGGRR